MFSDCFAFLISCYPYTHLKIVSVLWHMTKNQIGGPNDFLFFYLINSKQ
jgi:hypothetical protein